MGFAKSRPATAQRPDGPAARRPGGPVLIFHSFWPAVNPRACTDLHPVWACKMDDGEFEFVYHFNNHFNPFRSFLSLPRALTVFEQIRYLHRRKAMFDNRLSFWGGVPVNRPTCFCLEKIRSSHIPLLMIFSLSNYNGLKITYIV